jgi:nucleotide-binding universal stress UspA family protein
MIETILVPTDGSRTAKAAAAYGAEIAKCEGAKVVVLSVLHPHQWGDTTTVGDDAVLIAEIRQTVNDAADELRRMGVDATGRTWETETDCVQDAIEAVAEEIGADLIVIGSHGRSGLDRALLGSVADRVLRRSTVPVLVVPKTYVPAKTAAPAAQTAGSVV